MKKILEPIEMFFVTFFHKIFRIFFRNFEIFIFQIEFPKIVFSNFFRSQKIFFEIEKNSEKNLRKVNLKNENFEISKIFRENLRKKVPEKFLKKVFSKIKKYFLSRFLFMIWNISLLLKNQT